jgi:uncharacterized protein
MRFIYTTDLHGCERKFDMCLQAAEQHGASLIVNGGDVLPKDGDLFEQDRFISGFLRTHLRQVSEAGLTCLVMPGNDDLRVFDPLFNETCREFSHVYNPAQALINVGSYEFIGMNYVCDYPFPLKDRCRIDEEPFTPESQLGACLLSGPNKSWISVTDWPSYLRSLTTIAQELDDLPRPSNAARACYITHDPPAGLGLDVTYRGRKVGSKAIYDFVSKQQPLVTLHGHIHESPLLSGKWMVRLGRTCCIQPGQDEIDFVYVVIDMVDDCVRAERRIK